ncbi:putative ABC transport system permease protein [Dyadobacter soli]|uniref:Putative ABC transport system permease protein n=1 Tax=Dyadobacter soli TaxID=659014 RepID=A0A1G7HFZ6_9BACT|nr:ABC transporter permease [Dyadobacter soli]SDE99427.1 putative ABC transport system permease protein [Dyadobacter soli]
MLKNYFKIAWRNLLKRRFYALVTILGLTVGMTFSFLMMSYIWGEWQVNSHLANAKNQCIIRSKWTNPNMGLDLTTLGPLGKALKTDYPNLVANYYRYDAITVAVSHGDKHFREDVQTGDSTLLAMYGFPLLHGHAQTALNAPNSIVITENKAMKYFGQTDVVGESLTLHNFMGGKQEYQITAVIKNPPFNSVTHLLNTEAEIFFPFSSLEGRKGSEDNWNFPIMVTYIELKDGVTPADLAKPMAQEIASNAPEAIKANLKPYLTPLSEYYREANDGVVNKMILTLSGITLFILVMAVVNFVNISIGSSSSRLKEIGVRKVLGSLKRQLIGQFLAESVLLALLAMVISLGVYELLRPVFSDVLGKKVASLWSLNTYAVFVPLSIAMLVGLLAGLYPALVLSRIPSVESMKGKLKSVRDNVLFRRSLIAVQFVIALFVFAGARIVARQVDYFFNKNLGYNKESVVTLGVPRDWTPDGLAKMEQVRDNLARLKEVKNISLSYEIPNGNGGGSAFYKPGQDSTEAVQATLLRTDVAYASTYNMKLIAGEFLQSPNTAYQPDRIVMNETALRSLGYASAHEALGQQVRVHFYPKPLTIVGVAQDFHFESMHQSIKPLVFADVRGTNFYRYLSIRLNPGNIGNSMAAIQQKWRELMQDAPFEYVFIDATLQKLYQSEIQLKKAARVATFLSIVIVLLGILGMVSLNVARRTREVGIRKVLGATSLHVVMLFLKEFLAILVAAILVAFPLAILLGNQWLKTYAYRVEIGWEVFAGIVMVFAVMITVLVCAQTYKAAVTDPVKSLKGD